MSVHERYMKRCLELAGKGFGRVAPNPMVGCVIVYKGKVIGEGYHRQYGSAHAEVNAINSVKNKKLLKDAILYVNLEPCSHFGKTPPCADLIIKTGIKYVVIGTVDPNPVVMGRGLQKLVSSGCDVKVGILENECRDLNRRFCTFHEKGRPYVILKWAQTADKYIGKAIGKKIVAKGSNRLQISGKASQKLVHMWRGQEQAIMVGTNTALSDNPRLTVRKASGKDPIRILIDRQLKVPASFHLLDGVVPTLVFTARKKLPRKGVEYEAVDFKRDVLPQILLRLAGRNIQSVMVEGGSSLLASFLDTSLWDEVRVFTSNRTFPELAGKRGEGVDAPRIAGRLLSQRKMGDDLLLVLSRI